MGDDLPRVATELHELRTLSHQNFCRLYQFIETEDKYYIIMEYCSGGEMFDYIARKERLEESEARHFFRQLVQATAYVHSMGYPHRDLAFLVMPSKSSDGMFSTIFILEERKEFQMNHSPYQTVKLQVARTRTS
ncbi:unnamed protein product [Cylicocyclus nassatus]|uniref:Protein kinase domain-containing protein n=1 Tax=Cylicocyclus nassatus TaxID=53992 RepID=A0AA36M8A4_CYLNA|nr:unnamed protein product [Cylicocyclus nassatus]